MYCGIDKVGGKNLSLESGTNKNGIYSANFSIPTTIEPNTYGIYCTTNDTLKNNRHYNNLSFINVK